MGYYDYRAFGSPSTLPYTVNRAAYAMAPYYIWQSAQPEPHYAHPQMRRFYYESEMKNFTKIHSWSLFVPRTLIKAVITIWFFAGLALLPPLIMFRRALRDRRIRFLAICLLVLMAGMMIEIFLIPHYLAPYTAVFYAIGLQAMRHLRVWSPEGKPVGAMIVRLTLTLCFALGAIRVFAAPLGFKTREWPASNWGNVWFGPDLYGTERASIEAALEQLPGKQLVFVRGSAKRDPLDQWVYNQPDIDASKVVWAWEMDAANNWELKQYYSDRNSWLINMDTEPATVSLYPVSAQATTASH